MSTVISIVIICERAEQVTGGGCCGTVEDNNDLLGTSNLFRDTRSQQEKVGILYRMVRRFFAKELEDKRIVLNMVDPRNQLYLIPKLWRDVFWFRPGFGAGLRAALQLFSLPAVIVNGRVLSKRDHMIDPDALCHIIREKMGLVETVSSP